MFQQVENAVLFWSVSRKHRPQSSPENADPENADLENTDPENGQNVVKLSSGVGHLSTALLSYMTSLAKQQTKHEFRDETKKPAWSISNQILYLKA